MLNIRAIFIRVHVVVLVALMGAFLYVWQPGSYPHRCAFETMPVDRWKVASGYTSSGCYFAGEFCPSRYVQAGPFFLYQDIDPLCDMSSNSDVLWEEASKTGSVVRLWFASNPSFNGAESLQVACARSGIACRVEYECSVEEIYVYRRDARQVMALAEMDPAWRALLPYLKNRIDYAFKALAVRNYDNLHLRRR